MLELISAGCQLGRLYALAAEKKFFAHFSKDQADGERGHGENRRASQDRSQGAGELRIGHRIRRDGIDRALQSVVRQYMMNGAGHVIDRHPAPPLPSAAKPAAQTQAEGGNHFRQGAAVRAHHNSNAHLCGANSCRRRGLGCAFPLAADFGGEALAGRALFTQNLVSAVAVVTHGGSRDEDSRSLRRLGDRFRQVPRALGPALQDAPLLGLGPAADNGFSRQMDDRVEAGNGLRRDGTGRVPDDLILARG